MSDIRANAVPASSAATAQQPAQQVEHETATPPFVPRHDEFVTFMRNRITCDACQILLSVSHARPRERLHVAWSSDYLVVTEADDLHAPGRTISGRRIAKFPKATMFELLRDPAPGAHRATHKAAIGIAVVTWGKGGRRLLATGVVEGELCDHDRILDASEL